MEAKIFVLDGDLKALQQAYHPLASDSRVTKATIYPIYGKHRMMVATKMLSKDQVSGVVNNESVKISVYERAK